MDFFIKLKHNQELKHKLKRRQNNILKEVENVINDDYQRIKNQVFESLSHIVQSSATVECINSLLRPYLNTN